MRYVGAAQACGLERASGLTDGLVAEVAQRVQARPSPPPSDAPAPTLQRGFAEYAQARGLFADSADRVPRQDARGARRPLDGPLLPGREV